MKPDAFLLPSYLTSPFHNDGNVEIRVSPLVLIIYWSQVNQLQPIHQTQVCSVFLFLHRSCQQHGQYLAFSSLKLLHFYKVISNAKVSKACMLLVHLYTYNQIIHDYHHQLKRILALQLITPFSAFSLVRKEARLFQETIKLKSSFYIQ